MNTGKYLKYAIGEIILVVVGILIALSINNWNEERKSREQLKAYLTTIKKNVQSDTVSVNRMKRDYERQHFIAREYMRLLLKDSFSMEVLVESIDVLGEEYLNIDLSGFEAMKSSGFINKVHGTAIEDALFGYYGAYQEMVEEEESLNNFIESMEAKLFDMAPDDLVDALKLINSAQFEEVNPTKKPESEVAFAIFRNPFLVGIIQRYADEDSPRYNNMLKNARQLLQLIDQELRK